MTLLSLLIGKLPRALAFQIASVTAAVDASAPGAMPLNRVLSVPSLSAPSLPWRVEAPARKARSLLPLASTKALAST